MNCNNLCESRSIMSDSATPMGPHGLWPARLFCPLNSPGKNTGVGSYSLLQGNLPNPGTEFRSPALQVDSLSFEPPREALPVSSVQFRHSVMSDSLWPNGLQHARLPCPSLTLGACSNSCPVSQWCHKF